MFRELYLATIFLGHFSVPSLAGDVCPYKECSCSQPTIFCQQRGLTSVPALQDVNATIYKNLLIYTNQITEIRARSLPDNLEQIDFSNNPITIIDDDAFNGSTSTLASLSFSGARFTRIPDAFRSLTALKELDIYSSLILDWNPDIMMNIGRTMQILDLRDVGLNAWPAWFQNFTSLVRLSIYDSSIYSVPDEAFYPLVDSLYSLYINNCSLTSVPKALYNLTALKILDLGFNKIADVTFLPQQSALATLSLYDNNVSDGGQLSLALQGFNESLTALMIENNQLTAIPDFAFLSNLHILDLSNNRISDPHSGSLPPFIGELDLSHNILPSIPPVLSTIISAPSMVLPYNSITTIQATDFKSLIFTVSLDYNLLTELNDTSFPPNSNIRLLYLNGNPIATITGNPFLNLPDLTTLGLQGTRLASLPLQLASLANLGNLYMSNSTNLVCTCSQAALDPWIKRLYAVTGNCGDTSIHDFFVNLSTDCSDS
ncbi:hypothetical protein BsWGS_02240 [Bradybaena similaris]